MGLRQSQTASETSVNAKSICIIGGGGPAGLAAIKTILDSPEYQLGQWTVAAYELREEVGGIWLASPPTGNPPLTPLYDALTTNLPHSIMSYSSYPFPPSTPIFPFASVVQKYLSSFADHFSLRPLIDFNTTVTSLSKHPSGMGWLVGTSADADDQKQHFDAVMICNGHYRFPRYPSTPGLQTWVDNGRAMHSAWYRHPEKTYSKVIVVGSGPSGTDITNEMRSTSSIVIQSMSDPGSNPDEAAGDGKGELRKRGRVRSYDCIDLTRGRVAFEDGLVEEGVEKVILATGFLMSFPFLSNDIIQPGIPPSFDPIPNNDGKSDLWNAPQCVYPLARHMFNLQDPTLAFLGLPIKVVPFPLVEAQATVFLHILRHPSSFDKEHESKLLVDRYHRLLDTLPPLIGNAVDGDGESEEKRQRIAEIFHRLKDLEQFDHRDELYQLARSPKRAPGWLRELYPKKDILRRAWKELEKRGEAEEFVRGVGEGEKGSEEWVDVLRKLLEFGEQL